MAATTDLRAWERIGVAWSHVSYARSAIKLRYERNPELAELGLLDDLKDELEAACEIIRTAHAPAGCCPADEELRAAALIRKRKAVSA